MTSLIPYIGGKHRIAATIAKHLRSSGCDTLVDVFGGSAAVTLNAGFTKRIYNDADGDLVNLFRVIADTASRVQLLKRLRWLPPSRRVFEDDYREYLSHGFSFAHVADPVERARKTFYRHQLAFGGKFRSGGFTCSTGDRGHLKEAFRYRNALRRLIRLADFFRATVLENLNYSDVISTYGRRPGVVLFCDPPYLGTENLYSHRFAKADHIFLAQQLTTCAAPSVVTYYDDPVIRSLYPSERWTWTACESTKNMQRFRGTIRCDAHWKGTVAKVTEWIISRKANGLTLAGRKDRRHENR